MKIFLRLACVAFIAGTQTLVAADAGTSAPEKTPILELPFMEITVPEPPIVLHAGGHRTLCYELYITNMFAKPFTLESVRVLGEGDKALLESSGNSLAGAMRRPPGGAPPKAGAPATNDDLLFIKGSERAIFYAWVDLPEGAPVPGMIKHELSFKPEHGNPTTIRAAEIAVKDSPRIMIAPPLRGDYWCAVNGPSNGSHHRKAILAFDGQTYIGQRYAIDWMRLDRAVGEPFRDSAGENANYFCYGNEVYAVADGVVSAIKDGIPENKPLSAKRAVTITTETVGGNYVILDIGGGAYAFYAHLQPGKIRVKVGAHVKEGDVVGLLGNSGNSDAPHLHFQLCDRNSPLASQGLPYEFEKLTVAGRVTSNGQSIDWLPQPEVRDKQMPADGEMISFPSASP